MIAKSATPWKQASFDLDQRPVYLEMDDYRKLEALVSEYNSREGVNISLAEMCSAMIGARFNALLDNAVGYAPFGNDEE
jgi:hypothetical protein